MKTPALCLALVLAACDRESPPDPHFPQVSQLIEISGATASCHTTVAPTSETWSDLSARCEFSCVYSGTQLFKALRVDLSRASTAATWQIAGSEFTPIAASTDCPGMAR